MSELFYRPQNAFLADVIPFYWQGEYHLFYLKDWRNPAEHGEGTPWYHLVTRDFVTFNDLGEALPRGTKD
jgi:beta-fructofuranosidase